MNTTKTLTPRLIKKLWLVLILIVIIMAVCYVCITAYFANTYTQATSQRINANIATHLIEEKFANNKPFLEDGSVNKALFGDLMHDMMAVNRSIEVYLLNEKGNILYSVVLKDPGNNTSKSVNLKPIHQFIINKGQKYILGDDPRNEGEQKIFSAAPFTYKGNKNYIYIILAGEEYQLISKNLLSSYFVKLGTGSFILTILFSLLIGGISIWVLSKNLKLIAQTVLKFREGDYGLRIKNPDKSDVAIFANSFNEMADTIEANIEKMKSVDTFRKELIANVSHDIRTPLAILKGYVETLQIKNKELTQEEREDYLHITQASIDKLSKLISQLFEYSKLEAEQVTPIKEPFSITDLCNDLISKFEIIAAKKKINIVFDNPSGNNLVFADISLVERALQNLIENAIKFTSSEGKIILGIKKEANSIQISLMDNGIGISNSDQELIFERYTQTDLSSSKQGTGLGLAIVKKIMELHNTTITVVSKPLQGSTFIFKLPIYNQVQA